MSTNPPREVVVLLGLNGWWKRALAARVDGTGLAMDERAEDDERLRTMKPATIVVAAAGGGVVIALGVASFFGLTPRFFPLAGVGFVGMGTWMIARAIRAARLRRHAPI